jgi:DNA-binding transcriptional ArsR family regulator
MSNSRSCVRLIPHVDTGQKIRIEYRSVDPFEALADPTRRDIIELLAREDLTANQVADHFIFTRSAISQHLQRLRKSGLVRMRQVGRRRIYSLNPVVFEQMEAWLAERRRVWLNRERPPDGWDPPPPPPRTVGPSTRRLPTGSARPVRGVIQPGTPGVRRLGSR